MAKFTKVGSIRIPKGKLDKRYFKLDDKVTKVTFEFNDGNRMTLKAGDTMHVGPIMQGKTETDDAFALRQSWMKSEVLIISDSE